MFRVTTAFYNRGVLKCPGLNFVFKRTTRVIKHVCRCQSLMLGCRLLFGYDKMAENGAIVWPESPAKGLISVRVTC